MATNRQITLLVVEDGSARVRKVRVGKRTLRFAGTAIVLVIGGLVGVVVNATLTFERGAESRRLRRQNLALLEELARARERVTSIDGDLERLEHLDSKLRAMTTLSDPSRDLPALAVGAAPAPGGSQDEASAPGGLTGTGGPEHPDADPNGSGPLGLEGFSDRDLALQLALLDAHLDRFEKSAKGRELSLTALESHFEDQRQLLASMPSVWPSRGWVTSEFGMRDDPYTGMRQMHRGLDVAARPGTPILAPSDGVVVYAGTENGYGRTLIIDHGYDVSTQYGHLEDIFVQPGQKIRRGERIASVGNTGRSTGPHLHYEVHVHGIPQNPRRYILD